MEGIESVQNFGMIDMLLGASAVAQFVLLLLVFLSVWGWAITIAKYLQFKRVHSESNSFNSIFWDSRNLARVDDSSRRFAGSPLAQVFAAGYRELTQLMQDGDINSSKGGDEDGGLTSVRMALRRAESEELVKLEKGLTFLATVASAAPFIGLFGTVWGIMNAFHGLGLARASTIQAVAPGISEALVATAIGLAAAIPAAIAYNYFVVAVRYSRDSMDRFSDEFIALAKKYVDGHR